MFPRAKCPAALELSRTPTPLTCTFRPESHEVKFCSMSSWPLTCLPISSRWLHLLAERTFDRRLVTGFATSVTQSERTQVQQLKVRLMKWVTFKWEQQNTSKDIMLTSNDLIVGQLKFFRALAGIFLKVWASSSNHGSYMHRLVSD